MMTAHPDMLAKALEAHAAGLSIVPPQEDGSKRPMGTWRRYIEERADEAQLRKWYSNGRTGLGTVCGRVAGNLEVLEFEGRAVREGAHHRFRELCNAAGMGDVLDRIIHGYSELSPSGGYHLLYRVPTPKGNTRLARRPATDDELAADPADKIKLLVETRGEGGYIILAPSYGKVHPDGTYDLVSGSLGTIAEITDEERDELWRIARLLDSMPDDEPARPQPRESTRDGSELRPGDDYNERAGVQDRVLALLETHGWTKVFTRGEVVYLRRPGKNKGISATLGHVAPGVLRVFTTSTAFEDKAHSPFSIYTTLVHGGDTAAAARTLRNDGYGGHAPELPAVTTITAPPRPDEFWEAREHLATIRQFARARRAAPYATLGVVLSRIVASIEPHYVLPALVGGYGSLNLFVAVVGRSGAGKGAAEAAARDVLELPDTLKVVGIGSGEGINHQYSEWVPPNKKTGEEGYVNQHTTKVMFTCAEVDTLAALHSRQSSTTLANLRSAWVAESLGYAYVDKAKALPLEPHSYRATLLVGVQPARAGALLDDADAGTPQRFVWLPAVDDDAPADVPAVPQPIVWDRPHRKHGSLSGKVVLDVCDTARRAIDDNRLANLKGDVAALDGHALFCQLKVAAALAILDSRLDVSDDDWELSEHLAAVSAHTRQSIVADLNAKKEASNKARGEADAERTIITEERVAEAAIRRVARTIVAKVDDEPMPRHVLLKKVAGRDRGYFEPAVERLQLAGQIEVIEDPGATYYQRLGRPS